MGTSHQKGWVVGSRKEVVRILPPNGVRPEDNQPKEVSTPVALGLKSEMTKFEAREKLEREIADLADSQRRRRSSKTAASPSVGSSNNRYLPLKEADWREETAKVKKYLIQADLVDVFGDVRLENIDKFSLQTHLNQLAKTRSRDRVLHCGAYMKAIFAEAVDQDFLPKDPARTLKAPAQLRETDKTTLTWDQLRAALPGSRCGTGFC